MFIRAKKLESMLLKLLGKEIKNIPALLQEAKDLIGPAGDVSKLKREIAELKLQKTMEEREIKHLIKIKEEKLALEHQKKEVELQRQFQEKEMVLKTEYHDKVTASLTSFQKRQDAFFEQVMKRLPDVTVMLGQEKGKKDEE